MTVDPQIHGAIVGGLLAGGFGGITVAGGVVLDMRVRSRSDARQALRSTVDELQGVNIRMSMVLRRGGVPDGLTDLSGELFSLIASTKRNAHILRARERRAVRDACDDLSDMWMATFMRMAKGAEFTDSDALATAMPMRRINSAIFGAQGSDTQQQPFKRMTRYVEEGLSAPELEASERTISPT